MNIPRSAAASLRTSLRLRTPFLRPPYPKHSPPPLPLQTLRHATPTRHFWTALDHPPTSLHHPFLPPVGPPVPTPIPTPDLNRNPTPCASHTTPPHPDLAPLLHGNRRWAHSTHTSRPHLLPTLAAAPQRPKVLWIGCSDSRVPETSICGVHPGDIFVHRNVANQFVEGDVSAQAVLAFAVGYVGVGHVVVVGHSGCGGCVAAHKAGGGGEGAGEGRKEGVGGGEEGGGKIAGRPKPEKTPSDPLSVWLEPLVALRRSLPAEAEVHDLVEANVRQGVMNIANSEIMKDAWDSGKIVQVHGWVYDLASGQLADLGMTVGPEEVGSELCAGC